MRLPRTTRGDRADPLLHAVVAGGGVRQEAAAGPSPAAATPAGSGRRRRPRRRRRRRRLRRRPPRVPTEDEIWAGKTAATVHAEGVLADVYFDLDMYGVREDARRAAAEERRLHEAVAVTARSRWKATATSAAPPSTTSAWVNAAPTPCKGYLVSLGVAGRPHHRDQQGQGNALLHRQQRSLLAAEPPRPLRHHRASRRRRTDSTGPALAPVGRPLNVAPARALFACSVHRRRTELAGNLLGGGARIDGAGDRPADHE